MSDPAKRPEPHIYEAWRPDLQEEYSRAKNDDERRRMLLLFGFDQEHASEVDRLFPVDSNDQPEQNRVRRKPKEFLKKLPSRTYAIYGVICLLFGLLADFDLAVSKLRAFWSWLRALFS